MLPNFLVIGGMKCGSTTLYRDLLGHPDIDLPDKELNALTQHGITAAAYARCFKGKGQGSGGHGSGRQVGGSQVGGRHMGGSLGVGSQRVCGDVSTTYSMLPDYAGVAERALALLGRQTKIVYLVREPVSRAISHHRHMNAWHGPGKMTRDVDASCRDCPSLVNYSRYAMQLDPWRDAFSDDAISVVILEEYTANRKATIERLSRWLGVASTSDHVVETKVFNPSNGKTVPSPFWLAIRQTPVYRRLVRPWVSMDRRAALRAMLLRAAPREPSPPSLDTVEYLLDSVRDDEQRLRAFLGRDEPIWDFDGVRARFASMDRHRAA